MLFPNSIAYLDCSIGCSEDMLLAALLDAGFQPNALQSAIASLSSTLTITSEKITVSELYGTSAFLREKPAFQIKRADISGQLSSSALSAQTQNTVQTILYRLIAARARLAGIHENEVYLDDKTLAYCIAIVLGLEKLHITTLYVSSLPLTLIESLEEDEAVMQRVSLEILQQREAVWKPTSRKDTFVTPLSASVLASLATFEFPNFTIDRIGYGVKQLEQPEQKRAAYVSLSIGQREGAMSELEGISNDTVTVLSSNIDNMDGELLGGLMERLFTLGALDVSFAPIQMKKNRPATLVNVICAYEKEKLLVNTLLRETSTLGVRVEHMKRYIAEREQQAVETPFGTVLMKVKRLHGQIVSARPEYEECQRITREQDIPLLDVYRVLFSVAQHHFPTPIIQKSEDENS